MVADRVLTCVAFVLISGCVDTPSQPPSQSAWHDAPAIAEPDAGSTSDVSEAGATDVQVVGPVADVPSLAAADVPSLAAADVPAPGPDAAGAVPTCGDGACVHDDDETCETCVADCGACPVCGNASCETATGLETCESCPEDCGACSTCGDGTCADMSGEDCTTCAGDCGACAGCGDGACGEVETCSSCAQDCGACNPCGDGTCDAAAETCAACEDDCGPCVTCGDGTCDADEDCASCAKDCGKCQRKGCIQGAFTPLWGGVHAHTHVSDGQGTPAQAFAHARNKAKPPLDFLWLSDHHNGITPAEWSGCQAAADKYNEPGKFAAGCGYEKTVFDDDGGGLGHFNTLFPDKLYKLPHKLPALYAMLADCGPCLGQFNHPPWPGTFLDYKFFPVAADQVRLIEFNGHGAYDAKMKSYFTALGKGWSISPSWNEDNHHGGWGDTKHATLVWAPELTRFHVRAAVKARRTVATEDDTASLAMKADDVCWMGSVLQGLGKTTISVELKDAQDGDGFGPVDLFGAGQKVLDTKYCKGKNPCKVTFALDLKKATHVVAVAHQKDGDVLISGPIWYKP